MNELRAEFMTVAITTIGELLAVSYLYIISYNNVGTMLLLQYVVSKETDFIRITGLCVTFVIIAIFVLLFELIGFFSQIF